MQKVFVVDAKGRPCLPCHPARSRKLLREGRAEVIQVVPFTIQLFKVVKNPVGSFTVGVDDGAKKVGVAIVNDLTNEVVFKGEIGLRQDVKRLMKQRSAYRRTRRTRKLRHRQPRFDNRISKKIVPSIRCRKDFILRFIRDMLKRVNIFKIIVEEVKFNHAKYKYGYYFSLVEQGKKYLKEQVLKLNLLYQATFGYITKENRLKLGLSKSHSNDAIAIGCSVKPVVSSLEWSIKPKRTKIWESNPTKTCVERNGFRHYDLVKVVNRNKGVIIGCIGSLKQIGIGIRTKKMGHLLAAYSKTKLLVRPTGLVYMY